MKQYLDLVRDCYENGTTKTDRTGTGTRSIFARQIRFDLQEEFPIVHAKFTAFRLVVVELIWLLQGNTNIKFLQDNNCHIWDEWADENGDLGPVYGAQWRNWERITVKEGTDFVDHDGGGRTYFNAKVLVEHVDQIAELIAKLKANPNDRRQIVSAWNVSDIPNMKLPPCHAFFQFYVSDLTRKQRAELLADRTLSVTARPHFEPNEEITYAEDFDTMMDELGIPRQQLSCQLYQRSADLFLGVPFNIASYALLTHLIAQICGYAVGEFIWTGGDIHLYSNAFEKTEEMLARPLVTERAYLEINPEITDIDDFKIEDIKLLNYKHLGKLEVPVAV
jgi:thymidylate synthase